MSSLTKQQKAIEEMAEAVEKMAVALKRRGFTEEQAVLMVTGMLSSAVVYQPFQEVVVESNSATRH